MANYGHWDIPKQNRYKARLEDEMLRLRRFICASGVPIEKAAHITANTRNFILNELDQLLPSGEDAA